MAKQFTLAGIENPGTIYRNLPNPALYEHILRRDEGQVAHMGPMVVSTGQFTGRSPNDKFIVKEKSSQKKIWWSKENVPVNEEMFDRLHAKMQAYLQGRDLYVQDCYVGADAKYRLPLRVITDTAWQNLFARNIFRRENSKRKLASFSPEFTVISANNFKAIPEIDGTNSEAFVIVNFKKKLVLIGTTAYAGEIKKSMFSVMNYLMPQKGVLSMHCSANKGQKGDIALFFGLSGTGKTSLSSDPNRPLIGDDEHGWSDDGIFNFEGGCYAKVINLSPTAEPEIYATTEQFGTVLENVVMDPDTRKIDLDDGSLTLNTRAGYPIDYLPNSVPSGKGKHPDNIIMLTCDAFGVMPPIAKMTPAQAMYHFLSGYTAKVAGTERGITEPQATFSACFGSPFMVLPPTKYADLLGKKIRKQKSKCWLINTGWVNGPYGVGERIKIKYTRAMVTAALTGALDDVPMKPHPVFQVMVPESCPDVPSELLWPRDTWANKRSYDAKARNLAKLFAENFKAYKNYASKAIKDSAPIIK